MTRRKLVLAALGGLGVLAAPNVARAAAEAVTTFHSIGLAWSGSGGAGDVVCKVQYRPKGTTTWLTGYPLWFDARAAGAGTPAARPASEYRGSIVGLRPGTTYEVQLSLEGKSTTTTLEATTWSETFPIGSTTALPTTSSDTLTITKSGTATGYALYTAAPGGTATIDVAGAKNNDIFVDASFVIIRGLTLKGAATNAIDLGPNAHDVVIELNDISGFGKISTVDGATTLWGAEANAAVYCNNHKSVSRIIMQRNKVHHPRSDSNNWEEPRPSRGGDPHPLGPQAVTFESCGGNHVFRYNDIFSDADHYFQDAIGGGENFSWEGFPNYDSDIYGNEISQVWDDAIEAEGGDRNVRIWSNYMDQTYVKVATATASIGPIYVYRNVANVSRRSDKTDPTVVDGEDRGPFLKCGSNDAEFRGGRVFVFHNTLLQPVDPKYTLTLGCGYGLEDSGGAVLQLYSRNNLLQLHKTNWGSVDDRNASPLNFFDYDLYNGKINAVAGSESHGISGTPKYSPTNPPGVWALDPTSKGFDVGERLPNFNDDFKGAGPDMGAYENGGGALEWGVDAGLVSPPGDAGPSDGGGTDSGPGADGSVPPAGDASSLDAGGDAAGDAASDASSGCGCRVIDRSSSRALPSLAFALVGLAMARRRRGRITR